LKLFYPACIYEEGLSYRLVIPDIPECVVKADTLADAILEGIELASSLLLDKLDGGSPVPKPSPIESIHMEQKGFVNMLMLDLSAYAKKTNRPLIKRSVKIQRWLDNFAESQKISVSDLLEEALISLYEKQTEYDSAFDTPPPLKLIQTS
jgi:predicted RNase H-like HicB family nuclease